MDDKKLNSVPVYTDRRRSDSIKWDGLKQTFGREDLLPLWVADMDFLSPEPVNKALKAATEAKVFGYFSPPEDYFKSFIAWEVSRHGYRVEREWLTAATGVVGSIYQLIQTLTSPGDPVILLVPVYYPFMDAVKNTGRRLVVSELRCEGGRYSIDFDDFAAKVKNEGVKLFIHCSPHNPVGRVWRHEELESLIGICRESGVIIISDEIHHDIILPGYSHIPTATAGGYSDRVITLTSPSKTFNLAGFRNSLVIIENPELRRLYRRQCRESGAGSPGYLDYVAAHAAYTHGGEWLEELLRVIDSNYRLLRDTLSELDRLVISELEGTYLAWLDLGGYLEPGEIENFIMDKCGFAPDWGSWFFPGNNFPDTHIRINLATSPENIAAAALRLRDEIKALLP